eukprot:403333846
MSILSPQPADKKQSQTQEISNIQQNLQSNSNNNQNGSNQQSSNQEKKPLTIGNYTLGRDLGKGTFGKVKVGTHILTGEKVAVKILEKDKIADVSDVERVAREIHILKIVRHPHVVQLYEIIETSKELYLMMEYARGGELFEHIVHRKRLREKEASRFLHQIISGIEYLHKLGICHRDLKPENLLMDEHNNIKIVDFGLSNTYKGSELLKTACGSPCYAAPEMIAGKKYNGLMSDIWSCGVILFAMVCGYLPFEDPNTNLLYKKILNADYTIPQFVSSDCRELTQKILNTDPTTRIKIDDIRKHPWYSIVNVKDYGGIIVGQHPIPVDNDIVKQLEEYNFDIEQSKKFVEGNRHNQQTTTYYLLLKKHLRSGGKSIADITTYNPQKFIEEQQKQQNQLFRSHIRSSSQSNQSVINRTHYGQFSQDLTQTNNYTAGQLPGVQQEYVNAKTQIQQRLRSQEPQNINKQLLNSAPQRYPTSILQNQNGQNRQDQSPSPHTYFQNQQRAQDNSNQNHSFQMSSTGQPIIDMSQRRQLQNRKQTAAQQNNQSSDYEMLPSVTGGLQAPNQYKKPLNTTSNQQAQQNLIASTQYGGFTSNYDIPFMYFTPRDAIKFKKNKLKNQQMNNSNISAAIYNPQKKQIQNNSLLVANQPNAQVNMTQQYIPSSKRKIFKSVITQPLDQSQMNLSNIALEQTQINFNPQRMAPPSQQQVQKLNTSVDTARLQKQIQEQIQIRQARASKQESLRSRGGVYNSQQRQPMHLGSISGANQTQGGGTNLQFGNVNNLKQNFVFNSNIPVPVSGANMTQVGFNKIKNGIPTLGQTPINVNLTLKIDINDVSGGSHNNNNYNQQIYRSKNMEGNNQLRNQNFISNHNNNNNQSPRANTVLMD